MEKKSSNIIIKIILALLILGAIAAAIIILLQNKGSSGEEKIEEQIIELQTKSVTLNDEEKNIIDSHDSDLKVIMNYDKDNIEEINANIYYLYETLETKAENLPKIKEEFGDAIIKIELHEEDPTNKIIYIELSEEKTKEIFNFKTKSDIEKFIKEQEKKAEELKK